MKKWYCSRTIWFAILQAFALILMAFHAQFPLLAWLGGLSGMFQIALRMDTSTKIQGSLAGED